MAEKGIPTDKVPAKIQSERIKICEACPTNRFFKLTRNCKACLCFMDIKTSLEYDPVKSIKTGSLTRTSCPEGHWEAYVSPDITD